MHPSPIRNLAIPAILVVILASLTLLACQMRLQVPASSDAPEIPKYEFEATGEDYLVSALDEVHAIADWAERFTNTSSRSVLSDASLSKKMTLSNTATDTVYIYGQVIAGGYGAVVTERYAYPKGILLITVRKTFGKENGHIVTETSRYSSRADFLNDHPQQTNVTELFGSQQDTIVTYVLRNGRLETYTFRLPVITRTVSPLDGSVRVTTRYASGGVIVSKTEDGNGNLIQVRRSFGSADGSTVTRTEFSDHSWKQVRTLGQPDRSILRETTSGFQSLSSGLACPIGRPPILKCMPQRLYGEVARRMTGEETSLAASFASGCVARPPKVLPPPPTQRMLGVASFVVTPDKKPYLRSLASGCPLRPAKPPIFQPLNQHVLGEATCGTTSERQQLDRSLASGGTVNKLPQLQPPSVAVCMNLQMHQQKVETLR